MNIPDALRDLPSWVCWRYQTRQGKSTKVPICPASGRCASSSDPGTWSSLSVAERAMHTHRCDGLGFVFSGGGNLFGVDLDNCLSADGELAGWAEGILDGFPTYAEVSPSGSGVKLFASGVYCGIGKRKQMGPAIGGKVPRVEVYGWGRYFAFTGKHWPGSPADVRCCQAALWRLLGELWPAPVLSVRPTPPSRSVRGVLSLAERASRALAKVPPAVSGQHGHDRTYRAARLLCHDFGLSSSEAFPLLADWNQRCRPPWTEKELLHKLRDAEVKPGDRPRGWFVGEGRTA